MEMETSGWTIDEYVTARGENLVLAFLSRQTGKVKAEAIALLPEMKKLAGQIEQHRDRLIERVIKEIPGAKLNGSLENRLPNNANLNFGAVKSKIDSSLIVALDLAGFAISAGSACQSKAQKPSHVLTAIGLSPQEVKKSIRVSLGKTTTMEEIDGLVEALKKILEA